MEIHIGCCGWAAGRKKYFQTFSTVELQSTFYKLPKPEMAEKLANEAPKDFIFCLKAWQAITHPITSPTWKRSGISPEELKKKEYGFLRPTKDNFEAWKLTMEICERLSARICVIQTPPSFGFSEENMKNMKRFFGKAERGKILLAWEPRGTWSDHPDKIREMCTDLDLIHVVDPLRMKSLHFGSKKVAYFRLHGFGKPSIYNYKYSDEELRRILEEIKKTNSKEVFCMFNNVYMFEDAKRLKEMVDKK
ncbi:MAG: DUF72 domain-containing protein [Candidatus Hadarchaeales archaeon]